MAMSDSPTKQPQEATPEQTSPTASEPLDPLELEQRIIQVLRSIFDPEIPVNIYDLGLIYKLEVQPTGEVYIRMTLTSPMCPSAATLPYEVEQKVRQVPGVTNVKLELVWDPPYHPSMMSDAARIQLGFFD
jgi:FeS assembly SUF system protein